LIKIAENDDRWHQEGEDVDVDGEALGGHVAGEELDPREEGQRHHGEDLGDLGGGEPQQKGDALWKSSNFLDCCAQGCQMVYFQTKNPNLGKFVSVLQ
jgi:hypothetical protein